jgi:hypothetical protein
MSLEHEWDSNNHTLMELCNVAPGCRTPNAQWRVEQMGNYYELALGRWEGEGGALEGHAAPTSAGEYAQEPAVCEFLTPASH